MRILLNTMCFLFIAQASFSQTAPTADKKISESEKAELKSMRKDLNLSKDQKAKLKEIHKNRKANAEARKTMSKEERRAANKADRAKVDEVLNDEQDAKMQAIRKKRKEFRKN